ncbi:MAG: hypothetical protein IKK70_00545 [Clostridia bacterium]|nr:hypothetical protein [Clostridia bacterium]
MFFKKRLKDYDPEAEEKLSNEIEAGGGVEKGDVAAMLISAFMVFIPVALLALGVLALVAWLFTI